MQSSKEFKLKIVLQAAVLAITLSAPSLFAQTPFASTTIGQNYTHLAAFPNPATGSACYLGYNTGNGAAEMGTVTSNAITMVSHPSISPGWTQLAPFMVGTTPYYVAYNSSSGRYQINRVASDCGSIAGLFDSGQGPGLFQGQTQVVVFYVSNTPLLMTYNSSASDVNFYSIDTNTWNLIPRHSLTLGQGFTVLMPYYVNGFFYFIAYNGSNGFVEFEVLLDVGYGPFLATVGTDNWGPTNSSQAPWVALVPDLEPGTQKFFGYNSFGQGVVDVMNVDPGTGHQTAQNWPGTWRLWPINSLFAPFYFQKVDSSGINGGFLAYQPSGQLQVWLFP